MPELLKVVAIGWLGACIRNKDDRDKTIKFINGISNTLEKTISEFIPKGGAVRNVSDEAVSEPEPDEPEYE